MEEKPLRFEKREDENGNIVFGAVFEIKTEEFRPSSESEARRYYDDLIEKRANLLKEQDSIEEQLEKYDEELDVFGDVFTEDSVKVEEEQEQEDINEHEE